MKILRRQMPDSFNVFCFGDAHVGSMAYWEKGFDKMLSMMESEYDGIKPECNFGFDHGDDVEAITVDDRKRFDMLTQKNVSLIEQAKFQIKKLSVIKNRLLCVLDGNHTRTQRNSGEWAKFIAEELDVPFGTYTCKHHYLDEKGKLMFKQFATHGFGSIGSKAYPKRRAKLNDELKLRAMLENKAADCYVMSMGHTHKLITCSPDDYLFLTDDGLNLREWYTHQINIQQNVSFIPAHFRWFLNTGSFRRTNLENASDYAEIAGHDPVQLGFGVIRVRNKKVESVVIERV